MRREAHVRFGERDGRDRPARARYGAPVPTLRAPSPSQEDRLMTRRIREAGDILGISVVDHLIVGANGQFVSLRDRGELG